MARSWTGVVLFGLVLSCAGRSRPHAVQVAPPGAAELQSTAQPEREFLSAPLLPCHLALVRVADQLPDWPTLAHAISMPYERLLAECQPHYPQIILPTASPPLSEQQSLQNQTSVSDCAYHRYGSKPYWIPQMLSEVDVCQVVLGEPWRLPTEADLAAIPEAELERLRNRPGTYFSSKFYVRTKDGLAEANLGQSRGVRPLHSPGGKVNYGSHLEGGIGVRCFRGPGPVRPPRSDRAAGWACEQIANKSPPPHLKKRPPPPEPASPAVQAFSRYGDLHIGGTRALDIAETYRQMDIVRPELERAVEVLKEPEPVDDPEGSARWKAWISAKRDKWQIQYALNKIDARIDRERKPPHPTKTIRGKKPLPYVPVPKQRVKELEKLQKAVVELLNLGGKPAGL
jgi:hypothetical protein